MTKYLSIAVADIKNIRRDPTLLLILIAPALMLAVVNYGITALLPFINILPQFYLPVVMFFSLIAAALPGFIFAFILLDEKDMGLYDAFKVTPLQLKGVLTSRMVFIAVISFFSSILLLRFNNLVRFNETIIIEIALLCALNSPILVLLITTFAKNKIEGLSYLKASTVTLIIPLVVLFTHSNWENLLCCFPAYWVFKLPDTLANSTLFFIAGLAVLLAINWQCLNFATKRN